MVAEKLEACLRSAEHTSNIHPPTQTQSQYGMLADLAVDF
jgi:hypothetical protein